MKKRLLFLVTLMMVSALGLNSWAQTNYLSNWDGGSDTSSPSNFGWSSSAGRTLEPLNNNGGIRITTGYSGYTLEDGSAYSYSANSELSSKIFWLRYNTAGESFTYTFKGLEPSKKYKFSGLVGWHNNSDAPTFTVKLSAGSYTLATMPKAISTKQKLYEITAEFYTIDHYHNHRL